jgi:hypothetical protein
MSELKRCPRCGAEAHVVTEDGEPTMFLCEDCGSWLDVSEFETTENAFKWWNDRPFIDALHARIAELEAAQRWHVVADGELPKTYKPVLTVDMSEATQVPVPAFYNPDTECWSTHFKYDLWVTHWMPLPELPEVK